MRRETAGQGSRCAARISGRDLLGDRGRGRGCGCGVEGGGRGRGSSRRDKRGSDVGRGVWVLRWRLGKAEGRRAWGLGEGLNGQKAKSMPKTSSKPGGGASVGRSRRGLEMCGSAGWAAPKLVRQQAKFGVTSGRLLSGGRERQREVPGPPRTPTEADRGMCQRKSKRRRRRKPRGREKVLRLADADANHKGG